MEQRQTRSPVDTAMLTRCDKCRISIEWNESHTGFLFSIAQDSCLFLSRFVDEFPERGLQLTGRGGAHIKSTTSEQTDTYACSQKQAWEAPTVDIMQPKREYLKDN